MPSDTEMERLSTMCEAPVIQLFKRNANCRPVDISRLLTAYDKNFYDAEDIKNATDLIQKCLRWVPADRISSAEAVEHPLFKEVSLRK
jgi:serine/threonine protein kinase